MLFEAFQRAVQSQSLAVGIRQGGKLHPYPARRCTSPAHTMFAERLAVLPNEFGTELSIEMPPLIVDDWRAYRHSAPSNHPST